MTDERITEIFGSVPYFIDEIIQPYRQEASNRPFVVMHSWAYAGSVNIMRVCGTDHPEYAGMTWREFLSKGRRMDSNLEAFRRNSTYYTDIVERRPGMSLSIIDGKGYVTEDGNHRTCIGRCFLYSKNSPFMHGVRVSEIQTDSRMRALYARLISKLPGNCVVMPVSRETKRDDGNGWATHFYELRLRVENIRRNGYFGLFDADELEQGILPVLRSRWNARFSKYRKLFF